MTMHEDTTRVPIAEWDALTEHFRRLAPERVEAGDAELTIADERASFTVTRDGTVSTGMPLHGFEKTGVEALYIDHDADTIGVRGPDGLAYEYTVP